jgi:hypothetical protein
VALRIQDEHVDQDEEGGCHRGEPTAICAVIGNLGSRRRVQ